MMSDDARVARYRRDSQFRYSGVGLVAGYKWWLMDGCPPVQVSSHNNGLGCHHFLGRCLMMPGWQDTLPMNGPASVIASSSDIVRVLPQGMGGWLIDGCLS